MNELLEASTLIEFTAYLIKELDDREVFIALERGGPADYAKVEKQHQEIVHKFKMFLDYDEYELVDKILEIPAT